MFCSSVATDCNHPSSPPLFQVASLCEYPDLLKNEVVKQIYPKDAIARAEKLLSDIGSIGAYSHSKGVPAIRKTVASFLESECGELCIRVSRSGGPTPQPRESNLSAVSLSNAALHPFPLPLLV